MRPPEEAAAQKLSRFTLVEMNTLDRMLRGCICRQRILEAVKNLVRRVLQPSIGLVQLTGCLGGQLAELIAIRDVGESSKNKI